MRLNRNWPETEIQSVVRQLTKEYPSVPADVTALLVQVARTNLSPEDGPAVLLATARRLLGRSILMNAIQDAPQPGNLAMAS